MQLALRKRIKEADATGSLYWIIGRTDIIINISVKLEEAHTTFAKKSLQPNLTQL